MNDFVKNWYDSGAAQQFESASEGDSFFHKVDEAFEIQDWVAAKKLFDTTTIDTTELEKYINIVTGMRVVNKEQKVRVQNNALIFALFNELTGDRIFEIPEHLSYEDTKAINEELRIRAGGKILPFVIAQNVDLEGKIIAERGITKQSIDLVRYYEPKTQNEAPFATYFGEGWPKGKPVKILSQDFFAYDFESKNKQYLLLTKDKIGTTKIKVKGMYAACSDKVKVGGTFALPSNVEVVFVNSWKDNKVIYTEEQIKEWFTEENHETLVKKFLGKYRHPYWFEQATFAILFSGIYRGYPLHFTWVGPAGSGKTHGWMKPLNKAIPDNFVDSKSTFKSYIPSYGGTFHQGFLLTSERICYGDEFLSSLITSSQNNSDAGNNFGKLTSLLEWDNSPSGSGNTGTVSSICPTMQLLACTNFQAGLQNIAECSKKLNNAAMSRSMWYVQTDKHINYCMDKKDSCIGITDEEMDPVPEEHTIHLYDFFKTRFVKLDGKKIVSVIKDFAEIIPNTMSEVYSRYDHHYCCLVDGAAKYRWLIGEKDSLDEADNNDYLLAQQIFENIILSWGMSLDFESISKDSKTRALTAKQNEVYRYICDEHGINSAGLETKFGGEISGRLGKLVLMSLVKEVEGGWYPFWHHKFKMQELSI